MRRYRLHVKLSSSFNKSFLCIRLTLDFLLSFFCAFKRLLYSQKSVTCHFPTKDSDFFPVINTVLVKTIAFFTIDSYTGYVVKCQARKTIVLLYRYCSLFQLQNILLKKNGTVYFANVDP